MVQGYVQEERTKNILGLWSTMGVRDDVKNPCKDTKANGGIPTEGDRRDRRHNQLPRLRILRPDVYRDNAGLSESKIGRWLGVAKNVGTTLTFYVLTQTGQVVSRSSGERVKEIEKRTDEMKGKLEEFDMEINRRLKFDDLGTDGDKPDPHQWADLLDVDPDFREEFFRVYEDDGIKEADDESSPEISDVQFLNMELAFPRDGEGPEFARDWQISRPSKQQLNYRYKCIRSRVFRWDVGKHNRRMHVVQIDHEGNRLLLFQDVIDHRSTKDAVTQVDAFTTASNGRSRQRQTAKGWELLLRWSNGSETWVPLKDAKESFPVQVESMRYKQEFRKSRLVFGGCRMN
jgi:hypothetical protein